MNASDQVETAVLRRMTSGEKVAVMTALSRQAWALTAAAIRARHPTWRDPARLSSVVKLLPARGAGAPLIVVESVSVIT